MSRAGNKKLTTGVIHIPVAAGAKLVPGTMAAVNSSGYAVAATKTTGLIMAGCVVELADNSNGLAGDISVAVDRGTFVWDGDSTVLTTSMFKPCYIKDDHTVSLTSEGSSLAGIITAIDSDGVTVEMMPPAVIASIAQCNCAEVPAATTEAAGKVKMAANQAASTATDAAGAVTDFNSLLSKLKTAGLMAPDATE